MRWLLILVLLTGVARAETPTDQAKAIIERQRALLDKDRAGVNTLLASMDPNGIVIGEMSVATQKELVDLIKAKSGSLNGDSYARNSLSTLFWTYYESPNETARPMTKSTVKSTVNNLVAGSRGDALWFTFDLGVDRSAVIDKKPFNMKHTFRITEFVVAGKVMLFHLDKAMPDKWDDLPSAGGGPPEGEHFEVAPVSWTPR